MSKQLYFDTHCHLAGAFYRGSAEADLAAANAAGVTRVLLPGTSIVDSYKNIAFAKKHHGVYAAAGIHPLDVKGESLWEKFWEKLDSSEIVAIGETGIDLYRDNHPPLEWQVASLREHIAYALEHKKPLIVHARSAEAEVYAELKNYPNLKVIMHCYTGSWAWAEKFLALGAYISIAGVVTYEKAITVQEVARKVPLNRLLCETDAPFLTPAPNRTKANVPQNIPLIANFIAKLRAESVNEVLEALYENASQVFGI